MHTPVKNMELVADLAGNIECNVNIASASHAVNLPPFGLLFSTHPHVIGMPVDANLHLVHTDLATRMEPVLKFVDSMCPDRYKDAVLREARTSIGACCLRRWVVEKIRTKGGRTDLFAVHIDDTVCENDKRIFESKRSLAISAQDVTCSKMISFFANCRWY
jgi:hypothetical protein